MSSTKSTESKNKNISKPKTKRVQKKLNEDNLNESQSLASSTLAIEAHVNSSTKSTSSVTARSSSKSTGKVKSPSLRAAIPDAHEMSEPNELVLEQGSSKSKGTGIARGKSAFKGMAPSIAHEASLFSSEQESTNKQSSPNKAVHLDSNEYAGASSDSNLSSAQSTSTQLFAKPSADQDVFTSASVSENAMARDSIAHNQAKSSASSKQASKPECAQGAKTGMSKSLDEVPSKSTGKDKAKATTVAKSKNVSKAKPKATIASKDKAESEAKALEGSESKALGKGRGKAKSEGDSKGKELGKGKGLGKDKSEDLKRLEKALSDHDGLSHGADREHIALPKIDKSKEQRLALKGDQDSGEISLTAQIGLILNRANSPTTKEHHVRAQDIEQLPLLERSLNLVTFTPEQRAIVTNEERFLIVDSLLGAKQVSLVVERAVFLYTKLKLEYAATSHAEPVQSETQTLSEAQRGYEVENGAFAKGVSEAQVERLGKGYAEVIGTDHGEGLGTDKSGFGCKRQVKVLIGYNLTALEHSYLKALQEHIANLDLNDFVVADLNNLSYDPADFDIVVIDDAHVMYQWKLYALTTNYQFKYCTIFVDGSKLEAFANRRCQQPYETIMAKAYLPIYSDLELQVLSYAKTRAKFPFYQYQLANKKEAKSLKTICEQYLAPDSHVMIDEAIEYLECFYVKEQVDEIIKNLYQVLEADKLQEQDKSRPNTAQSRRFNEQIEKLSDPQGNERLLQESYERSVHWGLYPLGVWHERYHEQGHHIFSSALDDGIKALALVYPQQWRNLNLQREFTYLSAQFASTYQTIASLKSMAMAFNSNYYPQLTKLSLGTHSFPAFGQSTTSSHKAQEDHGQSMPSSHELQEAYGQGMASGYKLQEDHAQSMAHSATQSFVGQDIAGIEQAHQYPEFEVKESLASASQGKACQGHDRHTMASHSPDCKDKDCQGLEPTNDSSMAPKDGHEASYAFAIASGHDKSQDLGQNGSIMAISMGMDKGSHLASDNAQDRSLGHGFSQDMAFGHGRGYGLVQGMSCGHDLSLGVGTELELSFSVSEVGYKSLALGLGSSFGNAMGHSCGYDLNYLERMELLAAQSEAYQEQSSLNDGELTKRGPRAFSNISLLEKMGFKRRDTSKVNFDQGEFLDLPMLCALSLQMDLPVFKSFALAYGSMQVYLNRRFGFELNKDLTKGYKSFRTQRNYSAFVRNFEDLWYEEYQLLVKERKLRANAFMAVRLLSLNNSLSPIILSSGYRFTSLTGNSHEVSSHLAPNNEESQFQIIDLNLRSDMLSFASSMSALAHNDSEYGQASSAAYDQGNGSDHAFGHEDSAFEDLDHAKTMTNGMDMKQGSGAQIGNDQNGWLGGYHDEYRDLVAQALSFKALSSFDTYKIQALALLGMGNLSALSLNKIFGRTLKAIKHYGLLGQSDSHSLTQAPASANGFGLASSFASGSNPELNLSSKGSRQAFELSSGSKQGQSSLFNGHQALGSMGSYQSLEASELCALAKGNFDGQEPNDEPHNSLLDGASLLGKLEHELMAYFLKRGISLGELNNWLSLEQLHYSLLAQQVILSKGLDLSLDSFTNSDTVSRFIDESVGAFLPRTSKSLYERKPQYSDISGTSNLNSAPSPSHKQGQGMTPSPAPQNYHAHEVSQSSIYELHEVHGHEANMISHHKPQDVHAHDIRHSSIHEPQKALATDESKSSNHEDSHNYAHYRAGLAIDKEQALEATRGLGLGCELSEENGKSKDTYKFAQAYCHNTSYELNGKDNLLPVSEPMACTYDKDFKAQVAYALATLIATRLGKVWQSAHYVQLKPSVLTRPLDSDLSQGSLSLLQHAPAYAFSKSMGYGHSHGYSQARSCQAGVSCSGLDHNGLALNQGEQSRPQVGNDGNAISQAIAEHKDIGVSQAQAVHAGQGFSNELSESGIKGQSQSKDAMLGGWDEPKVSARADGQDHGESYYSGLSHGKGHDENYGYGKDGLSYTFELAHSALLEVEGELECDYYAYAPLDAFDRRMQRHYGYASNYGHIFNGLKLNHFHGTKIENYSLNNQVLLSDLEHCTNICQKPIQGNVIPFGKDSSFMEPKPSQEQAPAYSKVYGYGHKQSSGSASALGTSQGYPHGTGNSSYCGNESWAPLGSGKNASYSHCSGHEAWSASMSDHGQVQMHAQKLGMGSNMDASLSMGCVMDKGTGMLMRTGNGLDMGSGNGMAMVREMGFGKVQLNGYGKDVWEANAEAFVDGFMCEFGSYWGHELGCYFEDKVLPQLNIFDSSLVNIYPCSLSSGLRIKHLKLLKSDKYFIPAQKQSLNKAMQRGIAIEALEPFVHDQEVETYPERVLKRLESRASLICDDSQIIYELDTNESQDSMQGSFAEQICALLTDYRLNELCYDLDHSASLVGSFSKINPQFYGYQPFFAPFINSLQDKGASIKDLDLIVSKGLGLSQELGAITLTTSSYNKSHEFLATALSSNKSNSVSSLSSKSSSSKGSQLSMPGFTQDSSDLSLNYLNQVLGTCSDYACNLWTYSSTPYVGPAVFAHQAAIAQAQGLAPLAFKAYSGHIDSFTSHEEANYQLGSLDLRGLSLSLSALSQAHSYKVIVPALMSNALPNSTSWQDYASHLVCHVNIKQVSLASEVKEITANLEQTTAPNTEDDDFYTIVRPYRLAISKSESSLRTKGMRRLVLSVLKPKLKRKPKALTPASTVLDTNHAAPSGPSSPAPHAGPSGLATQTSQTGLSDHASQPVQAGPSGLTVQTGHAGQAGHGAPEGFAGLSGHASQPVQAGPSGLAVQTGHAGHGAPEGFAGYASPDKRSLAEQKPSAATVLMDKDLSLASQGYVHDKISKPGYAHEHVKNLGSEDEQEVVGAHNGSHEQSESTNKFITPASARVISQGDSSAFDLLGDPFGSAMSPVVTTKEQLSLQESIAPTMPSASDLEHNLALEQAHSPKLVLEHCSAHQVDPDTKQGSAHQSELEAEQGSGFGYEFDFEQGSGSDKLSDHGSGHDNNLDQAMSRGADLLDEHGQKANCGSVEKSAGQDGLSLNFGKRDELGVTHEAEFSFEDGYDLDNPSSEQKLNFDKGSDELVKQESLDFLNEKSDLEQASEANLIFDNDDWQDSDKGQNHDKAHILAHDHEQEPSIETGHHMPTEQGESILTQDQGDDLFDYELGLDEAAQQSVQNENNFLEQLNDADLLFGSDDFANDVLNDPASNSLAKPDQADNVDPQNKQDHEPALKSEQEPAHINKPQHESPSGHISQTNSNLAPNSQAKLDSKSKLDLEQDSKYELEHSLAFEHVHEHELGHGYESDNERAQELELGNTSEHDNVQGHGQDSKAGKAVDCYDYVQSYELNNDCLPEISFAQSKTTNTSSSSKGHKAMTFGLSYGFDQGQSYDVTNDYSKSESLEQGQSIAYGLSSGYGISTSSGHGTMDGHSMATGYGRSMGFGHEQSNAGAISGNELSFSGALEQGVPDDMGLDNKERLKEVYAKQNAALDILGTLAPFGLGSIDVVKVAPSNNYIEGFVSYLQELESFIPDLDQRYNIFSVATDDYQWLANQSLAKIKKPQNMIMSTRNHVLVWTDFILRHLTEPIKTSCGVCSFESLVWRALSTKLKDMDLSLIFKRNYVYLANAVNHSMSDTHYQAVLTHCKTKLFTPFEHAAINFMTQVISIALRPALTHSQSSASGQSQGTTSDHSQDGSSDHILGSTVGQSQGSVSCQAKGASFDFTKGQSMGNGEARDKANPRDMASQGAKNSGTSMAEAMESGSLLQNGSWLGNSEEAWCEDRSSAYFSKDDGRQALNIAFEQEQRLNDKLTLELSLEQKEQLVQYKDVRRQKLQEDDSFNMLEHLYVSLGLRNHINEPMELDLNMLEHILTNQRHRYLILKVLEVSSYLNIYHERARVGRFDYSTLLSTEDRVCIAALADDFVIEVLKLLKDLIAIASPLINLSGAQELLSLLASTSDTFDLDILNTAMASARGQAQTQGQTKSHVQAPEQGHGQGQSSSFAKPYEQGGGFDWDPQGRGFELSKDMLEAIKACDDVGEYLANQELDELVLMERYYAKMRLYAPTAHERVLKLLAASYLAHFNHDFDELLENLMACYLVDDGIGHNSSDSKFKDHGNKFEQEITKGNALAKLDPVQEHASVQDKDSFKDYLFGDESYDDDQLSKSLDLDLDNDWDEANEDDGEGFLFEDEEEVEEVKLTDKYLRRANEHQDLVAQVNDMESSDFYERAFSHDYKTVLEYMVNNIEPILAHSYSRGMNHYYNRTRFKVERYELNFNSIVSFRGQNIERLALLVPPSENLSPAELLDALGCSLRDLKIINGDQKLTLNLGASSIQALELRNELIRRLS